MARYRNFAARVAGGEAEAVAGDATPDLIWANLRHLNNPFSRVDVSIAEVLAEVHPSARLILCLRDPADRLWSDFFYFAHRPNNERDLPLPHPDTEVNADHFHAFAVAAVDDFRACRAGEGDGWLRACALSLRTHRRYHSHRVRFAMGCYGPFVEEYLAQFSREQLAVVTLDDYRRDRRAVLAGLFAHLGVRALQEDEWETVLRRDKVVNAQGSHYKLLRMRNDTRALLRKAYAPCNANLAALLGEPRFLKWNP